MSNTNINGSNIRLQDSLYANLLTTPEKDAIIYYSQPRYTILSQISALLSPEPTERNDLTVHKGKIGNTIPSETISQRIAQGNQLELRWNDADSELIREGDVISSTTGSLDNFEYPKGRVTESFKGGVIITPVNSDSFAGDTFEAGSVVSASWDSRKAAGSRGKTSQTFTPDYDFDYISMSRESIELTRKDMNQGTYPRYRTTNKGGRDFWAFAQEDIILQRFAIYDEMKKMFSVRREENGHYHSGGMLWRARKYGLHKPMNQLPNENSFLAFASDLIARGNDFGGVNYLCLVGVEFMRRFQEWAGNELIKPVGKVNTLGGEEVKGIDVWEYHVLGTSFYFVLYPLFDNHHYIKRVHQATHGKPITSGMCLAINLDPVPTPEGTLPRFERYRFGPKDICYYHIPGTVSLSGEEPNLDSLTTPALRQFQGTASDFDGAKAGIWKQDLTWYNGPQSLGLMELF